MTHQARAEHWTARLNDWLDSGLSGAAFCKQQSIAYHQFVYWRSKLQKPISPIAHLQPPPGFARVTSLPDTAASELTLTLPGGIAITGLHAGNVDVLGAILRQL